MPEIKDKPDPLERLEKHIRKNYSTERATGTDEDTSHIVVDGILNLIVALRKDPNADLDDPALDSQLD